MLPSHVHDLTWQQTSQNQVHGSREVHQKVHNKRKDNYGPHSDWDRLRVAYNYVRLTNTIRFIWLNGKSDTYVQGNMILLQKQLTGSMSYTLYIKGRWNNEWQRVFEGQVPLWQMHAAATIQNSWNCVSPNIADNMFANIIIQDFETVLLLYIGQCLQEWEFENVVQSWVG